MQNEANLAEKNMKIFIFDYFFKFECLDMLDIADYDGTNGSGLLHDHLLPVSMAKLCKMRLFFDLECSNIVDSAECDGKYEAKNCQNIDHKEDTKEW